MGQIYDYMTDKPSRGMGHTISSMALYTTDVGEASYYQIRSLLHDFRTKQGKERPAALSTDKGNALFYYKQSKKYKQEKKAERWKKRYFDLGGSKSGIRQSVKASAPLAGLSGRDLRDFKNALTEKEHVMLRKADEWYDKTYK